MNVFLHARPTGSTRKRPLVLLAALAMVAAVAMLSVAVRPAFAAGASNPAPIIAPDNGVTVSTIEISGQPVSITDLNVTLFGMTTTHTVQFDIVLESPTGQRVMLMSDAPLVNGCPAAAANVNVAFDDEAAGPIPNVGGNLSAGTYQPTDNDAALPPGCSADVGDTLVPSPTATTLSAFDGTDPNGTWKLYVADDTPGFGPAQIVNGWSMVFTSVDVMCGGQPATIGGSPGDDVRFGTPGNDVIASGNGNDIVRGLGGDDIICGDGSDDKLKGGAGKDRLFGENGRDKLRGGTEKDYCNGGSGSDSAKKCEKTKQI